MSTCIVIATNKSKHNAAMVEEQPNMHGKDELSDDELQAINGGGGARNRVERRGGRSASLIAQTIGDDAGVITDQSSVQ
tara:strand:+ start:1145 stop:1381 length:237 start_codon:yes stop_codon:yes gene_type:complete